MSPHFELNHIGGLRILYVMAVDAEYGACSRALFKPLFTGVGPVESAICLGKTLAELAARGGLPDLVVSLGSAGSARLVKTQVYQASSLAYRDMDASLLGFEKGTTPFLNLPPVIELPLMIPSVAQASLSTGANIVTGADYAAIDADMVDMESYAVLRACQQFNVPFMGLRGISDGDAALTGLADWTAHLHTVDQNLAHACGLLEAALLGGWAANLHSQNHT